MFGKSKAMVAGPMNKVGRGERKFSREKMDLH